MSVRHFLFLASLLWAPLPAGAEPHAPNIVVVSIDGLRADRAHFNGNMRQTTPNLDVFAASSVRFTQAFSQSNESVFSHGALFTGLYPSELAIPEYLSYVVPPEALTLAEALSAVGYATGGFTGGGHLKTGFGLDQGFTSYYEHETYGSFFHSVPPALAWLDDLSGEQPFFLFLHAYDCHRPYAHASLFFHPFPETEESPVDAWIHSHDFTEKTFEGVYYYDYHFDGGFHVSGDAVLDPRGYLAMPEKVKAIAVERSYALSAAEMEHIRTHYDSGVLVADTYVGLFLEGLKQRGLWDDTVIIVLADHGEDLQDHGYSNHRAVVFDSTTHIPMLIGGGAIPAGWRGTVRQELTDAVDLAPTVMDMAGSVAPARARGQSLWALLNGDALAPKQYVFQQGVLGQSAVRTATHRLVFVGYSLSQPDYAQLMAELPIDGGAFQLFHSSEDPFEQHDIVHEEPELAEALRQQMVAWQASLLLSEHRQEMAPELRNMMRKHGYW